MALPSTSQITSKITRSNLDKIFTLVMMGNSVLAVVSAIIFFLSSWWIFLVGGILGFPLIIGALILFKYTNAREPIQKWVVKSVVKIYEGIVQRRAGLLRRVYTGVCWFVPRNEWKHVIWGYAKLNKTGESVGKLEDLDEEKRFYIQLYNYLATGFGNWPSLEGKNVLELRCGGGGGIDYLSRYLNPNLCIGVEESSTQSEASRDGFKDNLKLRFYTAETLEKLSEVPQIKEERIDLALSVQSSKYVRDFSQFIKEVDSVVRPGGFFAFSDLRLAEDWEQIERDLQSSSFKIMKKENISNNVMLALKLEEISKFKVVSRKFGSIARRAVKRFGIVKDNVIAESLASGNSVAMAYILHKVPQATAY